MYSFLLDLVRELNTLNDDNLADRVITNSDVQWCLSELQDILEAEQPTLTPPNEWVSVDEGLPEPTYCVLVYTTDYSIEVDARGSDGEWMSHEVTHWMPLPAPPNYRPPEGEA